MNIDYKKVTIPSNLSKTFCVNILNQCGIDAKHDNIVQSKLENNILVNFVFIEQSKVILEQCSTVRARKWIKLTGD